MMRWLEILSAFGIGLSIGAAIICAIVNAENDRFRCPDCGSQMENPFPSGVNDK